MRRLFAQRVAVASLAASLMFVSCSSGDRGTAAGEAPGGDWLKLAEEAIDSGEITFEGSGESYENAILVNGAEGAAEGVAAEYVYLMRRLADGPSWQRKSQRLLLRDGHPYDVVTVVFEDGTQREFIFDATDYYGLD